VLRGASALSSCVNSAGYTNDPLTSFWYVTYGGGVYREVVTDERWFADTPDKKCYIHARVMIVRVA